MALAAAVMMAKDPRRSWPVRSRCTIVRRTKVARQPLKTFPDRISVIFIISAEHQDVPVPVLPRSRAAWARAGRGVVIGRQRGTRRSPTCGSNDDFPVFGFIAFSAGHRLAAEQTPAGSAPPATCMGVFRYPVAPRNASSLRQSGVRAISATPPDKPVGKRTSRAIHRLACRRSPAWLASTHLRSSRYPVRGLGLPAGDRLNEHSVDPPEAGVGFAGHSRCRSRPISAARTIIASPCDHCRIWFPQFPLPRCITRAGGHSGPAAPPTSPPGRPSPGSSRNFRYRVHHTRPQPGGAGGGVGPVNAPAPVRSHRCAGLENPGVAPPSYGR
jgi:hypothetical protein